MRNLGYIAALAATTLALQSCDLGAPSTAQVVSVVPGSVMHGV